MSPDLPETPAELHDLLQRLFGIGDYDDLTSQTPYYRTRMHEIVKLKAMLRRRRVRVEDVAVAALWAHAIGKPITASWQIFRLIPQAKIAIREQEREARQMAQNATRNAAVIEAMEAGDEPWATRLMNASDRDIDAVIDQWRNR